LKLALPEYFPSVSSVKTALRPFEYLKLLAALEPIARHFLVSAFDLARFPDQDRSEARALLTRVMETGRIVLMDSGNYESYWAGANNSWAQSDFFGALKQFPCTLAFGFDEQRQVSKVTEHAQLILSRQREDVAAANGIPIVPIVHANPNALPGLCAEVVKGLSTGMLAIPERRLGEGVFQRVETVARVRRALDETGSYVGLHLLGTGNPLSLALFALAGADTFDGLEWCQTVVDHRTGALSHLSHAEFFSAQTKWAEADVPPQLRVLAHNLEFYADWIKRLRISLSKNEGVEFCRLNFPERIYSQCASALGWEARP
jgi:queuine/archaeosine tRNA-ribosyltransferase